MKQAISDQERFRLMLDAVRLFCDQRQLTRAQIAIELKTTPMMITRLLKEAEEKQYLKYIYSPPRIQNLEYALQRRFPFLKRVICIPSTPDFQFSRKMRAKALADYFEEYVSQNSGAKLAIGGGYTLYEMVEALPNRKRDIDIYPSAIIGRGPDVLHVDAMVILTMLWAKSGAASGKAHYLTVSPYIKRHLNMNKPYLKESAKAASEVCMEVKKLRKDPNVKKLLGGIESADIVFSSIGPVFPSLFKKSDDFQKYAPPSTIWLLEEMGIAEEWLRQEGAVGDIVYSYFNKDGKTKPEWKFFLALDLEHLRKMVQMGKDVVLTAGLYIGEALRAVLKGQLCNVLVIEDTIIEELLQR